MAMAVDELQKRGNMFFPLRNHSHYSLLKSTSRIKPLVAHCKKLGYTHVGICDINSVAGCVPFMKECKDAQITPIIGSEIVLSDGRITLFCKNIQSWKKLLKIISQIESFSTIEDLSEIITPSDFVCIDGYIGSLLCNLSSQDAVQERVNRHVALMQTKFTDYYLEIDTNDDIEINSTLQSLIINTGYRKIIPSSVSYYIERKDNIDHKVLMCVDFKTTLSKLTSVINGEELKFIHSSNFFIKTEDQIKKKYEQQYIDNMDSIKSVCEKIDILSSPKLPKFQTPNNISEIEYLKQLCNAGLRAKGLDNNQVYIDRLKYEMDIIEEANLSGYFLIVQDYVNHFFSQGCLVGPARGSAAGALTCYLTGITLIDPIPHDLLFDRFYNAGRNTKGHISLPDIDVDFPPDWREKVIDYIRDKYGHDKVCQMVTFGKMSGRSILKEVLRVNNACSFDEMNTITSKIPQESAISDLLEEMDEPSVIRWTLEHDPDALSDYCWLKRNKLEGDYAQYFEQALRMEGIYKTQGKHAAGVVISSEPLDEICPMIKPKRGNEKIAGMEMNYLEAIGCVKFDILGVSLLKTIMDITKEE